MIRRRAKAVGSKTAIGCHRFTATDNSSHVKNGGMLEKDQRMAAPSSPKTTNLDDRSSDQITLDEVERIAI
jgi:hypothetical protein